MYVTNLHIFHRSKGVSKSITKLYYHKSKPNIKDGQPKPLIKDGFVSISIIEFHALLPSIAHISRRRVHPFPVCLVFLSQHHLKRITTSITLLPTTLAVNMIYDGSERSGWTEKMPKADEYNLHPNSRCRWPAFSKPIRQKEWNDLSGWKDIIDFVNDEHFKIRNITRQTLLNLIWALDWIGDLDTRLDV